MCTSVKIPNYKHTATEKSDNKNNFFSSQPEEVQNTLTYSEAARWIVYLNSFDDTAFKPQGKNMASATVGWLGNLGIVYLLGENLFETLLLNLVMVNKNKVQCKSVPIWEKEAVNIEERKRILFPDNLAELYTFQSRRVHLFREDGIIKYYHNVAGDLLSNINAFDEPMTIWKKTKKEDAFEPMQHNSAQQMWREFSAIYQKTGNEKAGIIRWYQDYIYSDSLIDESSILRTGIVSVMYDKSSAHKILNFYSDSLEMHSSLLTEVGANARKDIEAEIAKCDKMAYYMGQFAQDLFVASGGSKSDKDKHYVDTPKQAKEQLYYRLDVPFRRWLRSIDPKKDTLLPEIYRQWQKTACDIALNYAKELVGELPESAVYGHVVKNDKSTTIYSAPKALNILRRNIRKIYERT